MLKVTNGLDVDTNITYKPLTDDNVYTKGSGAIYPDVDIQVPLYVVSSADVDNGVGGERETTYSFSGAKVCVDGRGFLGFASMAATDESTGITTTTDYHQTFPFIGMVTSTKQVLSDGTQISETTVNSSDFEFKVTATGLNLPAGHPGISLPVVKKSVTKNFEINDAIPQTPITTVTTETEYDDNTTDPSKRFGNPTRISVSNTDGIDTFTTETINSYHNDTSNWFLGRLICAQAAQTIPDPDNVGYITEARISGFEYDLTGSTPTGLLTKEVIEPTTADITEPGSLPNCATSSTDSKITLITSYEHDDFGNRKEVTVDDGPGGIASRTTKTTWGEIDAYNVITNNGRFAVKIENALLHREFREFDGRFGTVTRLTGPNDIDTTFIFDAFGRITQENRADGTSTTLTREWCDGFNGETGNLYCPTGGALALTSATTGAPTTVVYTDKLNREIQAETDGFDSSQAVTLVDTRFNDLGQVEARTEPFMDGDPSFETSFIFDDIGRLEKEIRPDGSVNKIIYAGLTTTRERFKNNTTTIPETKAIQTNNARGELKQSIDAAGTLTDYQYDPFGNLKKVISDTSALGGAQIITTNVYDIRGRKTQMVDPDMGTWTYKYDALGQLTQQTDAKLQITTLTYDKLGRLENRKDKVDDPDLPTTAESETVFTFDTSPEKGLGKLHKVEQFKGLSTAAIHIDTKTYTYDSKGRLQKTQTEIDEDGDGILEPGEKYSISQTFDEGRVATITYPASVHHSSGLVVAHSYSDTGYLSKVCKNVDYDDCDDPNDVLFWQASAPTTANSGELFVYKNTFGNGVVTKQAFKARTGLIDTIVTTKTNGGDRQDLHYGFDTLGNLKSREDLRISRLEEFDYDNLNRLKTVTLKNSSSIISTKQYTYDDLGNIKTKAGISGTYSYGIRNLAGSGDAGPHAVTAAGGQSFSYDDNGNLKDGYNFTQGRSRQIEWSAYNKPVEIKEGADPGNPDMTLSFTYGADRARIRQVIDNGTTQTSRLYVGGLYEKEVNGTLTTHPVLFLLSLSVPLVSPPMSLQQSYNPS